MRALVSPILVWLASGIFVSIPGQSSWTPSDVVAIPSVGAVALSPDGRSVVYIQRETDFEKNTVRSRLHLLQDGWDTPRLLLHGDEEAESPVFSPDGKRLMFLMNRSDPKEASDEAEGPQVYLLHLDGGEAYPVTALAHGVQGAQWIDDQHLLVSARDGKSARERWEKARKDDAIVVEDGEQFADGAVRLFRIQLKGQDLGELERLTQDLDQVQSFEVSPDGRWVIYVRGVSPSFEADERVPPRVLLRNFEDGSTRELFADRKSRPTTFAWAEDSARIYAVMPISTVDGELTAGTLGVHEVNPVTGEAAAVPLDWDRGIDGQTLVGLSDGFLAAAELGVRVELNRWRKMAGGWTREAVRGEHADRAFSLFKASGTDRVVYNHGAASDPDHWCWARLEGSSLQESKEFLRPFDPKDRHIGRTEIQRWRGALGEEVEGLLVYPKDYQQGQRYPLILMPHGGPHASDRDQFEQSWAYAPHLYSERGAFSLFVNYHGSSGYGQAFSESIRGRYYELELQDLLAGVQAQVDAGRADPARLGLVGWSNGAILAMACLTLVDAYAPQFAHLRFRVCVPGAGDVNWTSDYGNCAFGAAFDNYYLGGPPWKMAETYLAKSPLFHAEKVTTPTLILFGDEDTAVPTEQGWQWYRALQQIGKAPVRFVLFPGEPHGLRKPSSRRRKLEEELAWLDRYLFDRADAPQPRLNDDAPLAHALAAREYARVGQTLGVAHPAGLVPEVVPVGGVSVSRFEVTRAQWQSIFKEAAVTPGQENLPMTGVTAESAQEYVRRLSSVTGEPWRLLTEEEHAKLPTSDHENTLAAWIGFEPTWQEAQRYRETAMSLESTGDAPPLIRPVDDLVPGVDRTTGSPVRVFGAGGNASGWVVGADGALLLRGPDAVSASDPGLPKAPTFPAYGGLRVARTP